MLSIKCCHLFSHVQLLEKLIESKTTQETMAQTEVHLKTQLQIYTQKYSEFESTLNKSNEVFAAFKSEMEKVCYWLIDVSIGDLCATEYVLSSLN